jgi:hypothetical protein
MYKQVTVLRYYYATSDPDEFCFDRYKDSLEHDEHWVREYFAVRDGLKDEVEEDTTSRVYTQDLLPQEHKHQKGHWRITVEYIPTGKED